MVARIARNADRMTDLISQLLDFTRARLAGGFSLEPKLFDLAGLCSEILDDCQAAHPEATLCLDPDIDTAGLWDRERLAQVVSNLVGNAIQHGTPGKPIDVRVSDEGDDVLLTVHNEGVPIPADVLPVIFDPFRQGIGPARVKGKSESLGLGLFIAREIVRAHGGEISAQSAEGEGTTFSVRLPRGKR
jgi:signal transduction histidine kinase